MHVETAQKNKKAIRRGEKLFIGLTTKPCYELQSRSENNTTILNAFLSRRTASEETFIGQKRFSFLKTFSQFSGLDGTNYFESIQQSFKLLEVMIIVCMPNCMPFYRY
jgi:hypothetical protein